MDRFACLSAPPRQLPESSWRDFPVVSALSQPLPLTAVVKFESALFTQFTNLLGCHRTRTTACHPVANGSVERLHRQLKAALCAQASLDDLLDNLSLVLLVLRSTFRSDFDYSVA